MGARKCKLGSLAIASVLMLEFGRRLCHCPAGNHGLSWPDFKSLLAVSDVHLHGALALWQSEEIQPKIGVVQLVLRNP